MMFKKRFWRLISVPVMLLSLLAGVLIKPEPALALNINDYFTYGYTFTFFKTDKQTPLDYAGAGETFYVRASGTATCIKEAEFMGLSVSEASIVIKVVARQGSTEVVLNPSFTISYKPFPKKGETVTATQDVPLVFPAGSATGAYNVFGQILQANVKVSILTYDAKGLLPPGELEKAMGTVGYGVAVPAGGGGGVGGGGAGGGGTVVSQSEPITYLTKLVNLDGTLKEAAEAKSLDGKAVLNLPKGVKLTENGEIITAILMMEVKKENEPEPPKDSFIIGKAYDFRPNGLIFSQPIQITLFFDPASFPAGVQKKDLVIAWWDANNNKWVSLQDCQVDETANTVTGNVEHFTVFTLIAKPAPATATTPTTTPTSVPASTTTPVVPTTTPTSTPTTSTAPATATPASFTLSDLTITPGEIETGENILVSALLTNTGDLTGEYEVILKLNDAVTDTRRITLAGKSSQSLSFTVAGDKVGTQTVSLGELSRTFTVKENSQTPLQPKTKTINWWLIGALVVVGLIMGVAGFILRRQKPWRKL
ncbi:MAG: hypothetical protein PHY28_03145 [Dehalococcoidales bacterium]|nr:hypothetical protein [Dehalococcoidales bacterium]